MNNKQRYEQKRKERYAQYQALVKEKNDRNTSEVRKIDIDREIEANYSKERDAHERRMERQRQLRAAKKQQN